VSTLTAVHPLRAVESGRLTLHGTGFPLDDLPAVTVGDTPARVSFASTRRLVITVPGAVEGGKIPVRIAGVPGETAYVSIGSTWATGLHQVDSPVFDAEGHLFVTYSGSRGQEAPVSVFRVTRGGTREPFVSGIVNATSMAFGPDGRLYVAQQDGLIRIYDVTQPVPGQWSAVEAQTISLIKDIPNHNDDGSLNTSLTERQVTGILVTGTVANPVLYVTSSDPRIATYTDLDVDTNSGILSKLTWNGSSWDKVDLIRGLPDAEHVRPRGVLR